MKTTNVAPMENVPLQKELTKDIAVSAKADTKDSFAMSKVSFSSWLLEDSDGCLNSSDNSFIELLNNLLFQNRKESLDIGPEEVERNRKVPSRNERSVGRRSTGITTLSRTDVGQ